jgi:hypothetical protein
MKVMCLLPLLLLAGAPVASGQAATNPVSRVVELLGGVAKEAEKEGKAEQELYESFVCWGKSVIDQKTATNAAAEARISELETYIQDIDAGRIEFTSERVDLTKELAAIKADIESATALREKEHAEFLEAEDELVKAIAALDKAIEVLKEATKDAHEGVFLAQARSQAAEGFQARTKDAKALRHAVELGNKMLSKGDAVFLQRLLTGDVPTWDWKKLNRKATFKMSYKARSFKIQEVLAKMQATFTASLADARTKEKEATALYKELMAAKKGQEKAASEALEKMEVEMGARGKTKEESQAEIDALTEQVKNDEKFIKQVTAQLAEKKEEWKDRQELRAAELSAISKAIEILHNDDARDLMKRSFHSQGYMLLQESSTSRSSAAEVLKRAAEKSGDARLAVVASRLLRLGTGSHFTAVIKAIDDMIAMLKDEENSDLAKKEACEANRAEDTGVAIDLSRSIDESTDLIAKLTAEIEEINVEIEQKNNTIIEIQEQLTEATRNREDEHAEWEANDKDDTDAATTVQAARDVLSDFYTTNNLMFVQKSKAPVVEAGKAPPPPPSTWDAPYGGKTEGASGIIAILEMIKVDIEDDQAKAKKAEDKSQADFDEFKKESLAQIQSLNEDIAALTTSKEEKAESISQETEMRASTKAELASRMGMIKDAEPGCDYITITYPRKLSNRQIEIDGLRKAKGILQGAKFDEVDPNREIKPGDAASALQLSKVGRRA